MWIVVHHFRLHLRAIVLNQYFGFRFRLCAVIMNCAVVVFHGSCVRVLLCFLFTLSLLFMSVGSGFGCEKHRRSRGASRRGSRRAPPFAVGVAPLWESCSSMTRDTFQLAPAFSDPCIAPRSSPPRRRGAALPWRSGLRRCCLAQPPGVGCSLLRAAVRGEARFP